MKTDLNRLQAITAELETVIKTYKRITTICVDVGMTTAEKNAKIEEATTELARIQSNLNKLRFNDVVADIQEEADKLLKGVVQDCE
jgi:hypothetical protein